MRIEDIPRPWLLAAVTGVPVAALLQRAEEEDAEQSEGRLQDAMRDDEGMAGDRSAVRTYRDNVMSLPGIRSQ